jgi:uncharacterized protein involved in exopolysaccharide biosynthesis
MTELERILKDTLTRMEQEFSAALEAQSRIQEELRQTLDAHSRSLRQLQEQTARLKADGEALTKRLEDFGASCKDLETLLPRLNRLLNGG